MTFIGERIEAAPAPLELARLALLVGGIEQEGKRYLENFRDFDGVRRQREAVAENSDHRQNGVAGTGFVGIEKTRHRDEGGIDAGFLLRFAQGRLDERDVVRVGAPAGKRHLAGVPCQMMRALRQKNMRLLAQDERQKDRSRFQNDLFGRTILRIEIIVAALWIERQRRRLGQEAAAQKFHATADDALTDRCGSFLAHAAEPKRKKTPSLHTPEKPACSPSPGTARSASW